MFVYPGLNVGLNISRFGGDLAFRYAKSFALCQALFMPLQDKW